MLLRVLKLSVCVLSAASLSVSVRLSVPSRWYGTINLYAVSTGRFELGLGGLENARVSLLPMSVTNPELGLCYRIYAILQDLAMSAGDSGHFTPHVAASSTPSTRPSPRPCLPHAAPARSTAHLPSGHTAAPRLILCCHTLTCAATLPSAEATVLVPVPTDKTWCSTLSSSPAR